MKNILVILFLFSLIPLSSFAARDPKFCGDRDSCTEDHIPLIREGTYLARGEGHDCRQAQVNAEDNFVDNFGVKTNCGLYREPFSVGCFENRDGSKSVWMRCTPKGNSRNNRGNTPRCLDLGRRLLC